VDDAKRIGPVEGRQVERDFFGAAERFDSQFKDVRIDVFEHTALVTCVYEGEFVMGGQAGSGRFFLTFLLVNDGGQWKITHEALFTMPQR